MFTKRRPASAKELARLIESFDVVPPPAGLAEAEISDIGSVDDLGALYTVIAIPEPKPGKDRFYTVAQLEGSWSGGGGSARDQKSYRRALARAADPSFSPELLVEPTSLTSSGWWIIDGVHRAAALLGVRGAAGATALGLPVFVLARPLR
jgi:hypothetical protein